ncbi:MAG: hypothetical protein Q8R79_00740, partial [Legionellaceae bacterium]|nr:hypothetical protein [Legionellaceae bacterium]
MSGLKQLILTEKRLGKKDYDAWCQHEGLPPKKAVFIFPGNPSHHNLSTGTSLFTVKGGGGLAVLSGSLGTAGYPVLSMPTTGIGSDWQKKQKTLVESAIADLYRAVGAGYTLVLPVRDFNSKGLFFESELMFSPGREPAFWGENEMTGNKTLAKYYMQHLACLQNFIEKTAQQVQDKSPLTDMPEMSAKISFPDGTNTADLLAAFNDGISAQSNSKHYFIQPIDSPKSKIMPQQSLGSKSEMLVSASTETPVLAAEKSKTSSSAMAPKEPKPSSLQSSVQPVKDAPSGKTEKPKKGKGGTFSEVLDTAEKQTSAQNPVLKLNISPQRKRAYDRLWNKHPKMSELSKSLNLLEDYSKGIK